MTGRRRSEEIGRKARVQDCGRVEGMVLVHVVGELLLRCCPGSSQVSSGSDHTCALERGGDVRCWGRNVERQAPSLVAGDFVQVRCPSCLLFCSSIPGVAPYLRKQT